ISAKVTHLSFDDIAVDLNVQDDERIEALLAMDNFKLVAQIDGHISIVPYKTTLTIELKDKPQAQLNDLRLSTKILMDIVDADLELELRDTSATNSFVHVSLG